MTHPITRTQDEIVERYRAIKDRDFFGFKAGVLVPALDFEHAKEFLKPEATVADWSASGDGRPPLGDTVDIQDYLTFAVGKALDHRGISAGRSTVKLTEMAWLAGLDDAVKAMGQADHAQYGAPILKALAEWGSFVTSTGDPEQDAMFERMAAGDPCVPGCDEGCGR